MFKSCTENLCVLAVIFKLTVGCRHNVAHKNAVFVVYSQPYSIDDISGTGTYYHSLIHFSLKSLN